MTHLLKIHEQYFREILSGRKTFEIRKHDRDFQIGDILVLQLYQNGFCTGDEIDAEITYILKSVPEYGLQTGYCILGIKYLVYEVRNRYAVK